MTIPADLRKRAGLLPNTEVEFRLDGAVVTLIKVKTSHKRQKPGDLVSHLQGKGDVRMSTDEIMSLTRDG